jgi:glycosyltransferase involved in cell wall biosynthesis
MGEAVIFTGPVEGEHKALLLSQADMLLLPSYAEGLPYALLEAMAAGAVPIATPVGAIPDVVTDGVHGLLVPLRDVEAIAQAVARLAADRALLARMSAASRKRIVSGYSIERLAADFSTLYSKLCPARAPGAVL